MQMKRLVFTLVLLALFCSASIAGTAPWYQWRSKLNAVVVCAQTSPGEGWEKIGGPYKNGRCDIPGLPGV
jgi:hypothetical protein